MPKPLWTFFDEGTVARGLGYAADETVEDLETTRDGELLHLSGLVHGNDTYDTTVTLTGFAQTDGRLAARSVDGECSCPVGWMCKHQVALIATWLVLHGHDLRQCQPSRSPAPAAQPPAHEWRPPALLPAADEQPTQAVLRALQTYDTPTPLGFLLHHDGLDLRVQTLVVRWLERQQRWGVHRRSEDASAILGRIDVHPSPADLFVARQLSHLKDPTRQWGADGLLHRRAGASGALLEALLATGRFFLKELTGPALVRGDVRSAEPAWITSGTGLALRLLDPATRKPLTIVPVEPPWYLDGHTLGPVQAGDGFADLVQLPAMDPSLAATCTRQWRAAGIAVPDPPGIAPATPPTPVLLLAPARAPSQWQKQRMIGGHPIEVGLPCFRYPGGLVPVDGQLARRAADGSLLVRDLDAERHRLDELTQLGLVHQPAGGPLLDHHHHGRWTVYHHPAQLEPHLASVRLPLPTAVLAGLRLRGWEIDGQATPVTALDPSTWQIRIDDRQGRDWFELHLGVDIGGERVDLVPVLLPLLDRGPKAWEQLPHLPGAAEPTLLLDAGAGRTLTVPLALLERLRAALLDIANRERGPGGGLRVDPGDLAAIAAEGLGRWEGSARVQAMAASLRACLEPTEAEPPPGFGLTLRPYQRAGLGWMLRLRTLGSGGLLADDMGLGKTVQVLALVAHDRHAGTTGPLLIACPASMVGTWAREAARCVPGMPVRVHHGTARERTAAFAAGELVVTTYGTLVRDIDALAGVAWHLVVCDEAQAMKNAGTRTAAAVRQLRAAHRLCLTGTPIENHLGELHSYLDWLVPGLLGTRAGFGKGVRKTVEDGGEAATARLAWLRHRIAPFVLRRTKEKVAADLPPRTESEILVEMGQAQRELYESVRLAMDRRVKEALQAKGLARSHLDVLEALLALRQVCCDPRLARLKKRSDADSAKLEALADLLVPLIEDGRRVLVFSSFTSFLDLVDSDVLQPARIPFLRLDGEVAPAKRQELVDRFQRGEAPVFLLSLKAGGTGLTLTAADTVVILDPWWNPAAEAQAADRAHRIGQSKPVTIYRLICAGTVEERIRTLQERKKDLAAAIHGDDGQSLGKLAEGDIAALLAPMG